MAMSRLLDKLFSPTARAGDPARLAAPRDWFALDGRRIEYRDSGFTIELVTETNHMPYKLLDPEGRLLAIGGNLQDMKALAERHARDRAEFKP